MKNTTRKFKKLTGLMTLFFGLLAFSPAISKAQCPNVQNGLNCVVEVQVDAYTQRPGGGCGALCSSIILVLPPGAVLPANCTGCPGVCNVVVTVLRINGVPMSGSANFSTTPPGNPITGPVGPCTPPPPAPSPRIYYNPGMFSIMP